MYQKNICVMIVANKKAPAEKKIAITASLRKNWLLLKAAWLMNQGAFSSRLSLVPDKEADELYEVARHSLYKDSYVRILREHPELKELVKTDDDRLFMYNLYDILSWRLGKSEPPPKEQRPAARIKGSIGRESTIFPK